MLERNLDPLPVGIYWIAVQEQKFPAFDAWVQTSPFVHFLKAEAERTIPGLGVPGSGVAPFAWILFEVEHPSNMPHHFGFPTVAPKGRDTVRLDTIDEDPDPSSIWDEIPLDLSRDIKIGLSGGALALGVALLLAVLWKGRK